MKENHLLFVKIQIITQIIEVCNKITIKIEIGWE